MFLLFRPCTSFLDFQPRGSCIGYDLKQCKNPQWPPLCPFKIVDGLIPCQLWKCTGQPPTPDPESTTPLPDFTTALPGPDVLNSTGAIVGTVLSLVLLMVMVALAVYCKKVNFYIFGEILTLNLNIYLNGLLIHNFIN